jgi:magnesium-transporting ATPase (P-type)
MSFLIYSGRDEFNPDGALPNAKIQEFDFVFDKNDLAEFGDFYSYDKHALLKAKLGEMGGTPGLAYGLHTSLKHGLTGDDLNPAGLEVRLTAFGKNQIAKRKMRTFLQLCWDALQDAMLLLLIILGAISIPIGMSQHPEDGFIEGAAVLLAVAIVTFVTAFNDYQKQQQFRNMEDKSADKTINVFRNDNIVEIQHRDVVVGDVVIIRNGNLIPCDGIVFKTAGNAKVTEAALTGETKPLPKNPVDSPFVVKGSECVMGEMWVIVTGVGESTSYGKLMSGLMGNRKKQREAEERGEDYDPEAEANKGEPCCPLIWPDEDAEDDRTPLQVKLDVLAGQIGYCGTGCAILLFLILTIRGFYDAGGDKSDTATEGLFFSLIALAFFVSFFYLKLTGRLKSIGCAGVEDEEEDVENQADDDGLDSEIYDPFEDPYVLAVIFTMTGWLLIWVLILLFQHDDEWENGLNYFIVAVTVIVVAVPEGLPLAVTVSLAYSMGKMFEDNNFVRKLAACETMGNATTICSDKTGTLTTNIMSVVQAFFGDREVKKVEVMEANNKNSLENVLGQDLAELIQVSIACNSTASEKEIKDTPPDDPTKVNEWEQLVAKKNVRGLLLEGETNQTESACLYFTMLKLGPKDNYKKSRSQYNVVKVLPFDSAIKMSSVFVNHKDDYVYRLYIKGAAERIVNASSRLAVSSGGNSMDDVKVKNFSEDERNRVLSTMDRFTKTGLRCLGFGYREFKKEDIVWEKNAENKLQPADSMKVAEDIIFLGIVGIKDPVRDEVPAAVKACQRAGIVVRMVTGDHLDTAKHIAKECNILTNPNQICMTGEQFRRFLDTTKEGKEKRETLEKLRVVARSRPEDKEEMVRWYKNFHADVVAVTGDGANDALALQEAHVGLAMNIQGTDVAKEASDIVIMDDNFASIVKTVKWGRSVYDNIRKFVQFQLTVNVVALTLSLIAAFSAKYDLPLTAVQLLWVNLIMDTLAALALATEMPTEALLERRPYSRNTVLISRPMWRFVFVHSFFQLIICLVLLFNGESWLGLEGEENMRKGEAIRLKTIIFNTFVWMQIFNEINARKVNGEWNVVAGFFDNSMFSIILVLTGVLQFLIVQFGEEWTSTMELNFQQWMFCVVVGTVSFPVGQIVLWFPVDMTEGMVKVDPEWFYVDHDFVEGHQVSADTQNSV